MLSDRLSTLAPVPNSPAMSFYRSLASASASSSRDDECPAYRSLSSPAYRSLSSEIPLPNVDKDDPVICSLDLAICSLDQALERQQVAPQASFSNGVMAIGTCTKSELPRFHGSAFLIDAHHNLLITAAHILADFDAAKHDIVIGLGDPCTWAYRAELMQTSQPASQHDGLVVRIFAHLDGSPCAKGHIYDHRGWPIEALPLGDSDLFSGGEELCVLGYGQRNPSSWPRKQSAPGLVVGTSEGRGGAWLQISAAVFSGHSGGPVIDQSGQVIGFSVAQTIGSSGPGPPPQSVSLNQTPAPTTGPHDVKAPPSTTPVDQPPMAAASMYRSLADAQAPLPVAPSFLFSGHGFSGRDPNPSPPPDYLSVAAAASASPPGRSMLDAVRSWAGGHRDGTGHTAGITGNQAMLNTCEAQPHSTLSDIRPINGFITTNLSAVLAKITGASLGNHADVRHMLKQRPAAPDAVPKSFVCPITLALMTDPVSCADGHSYERINISEWLKRSDKSPLTGMALPNTNLTPNHALRNAIDEFMRSAPAQANNPLGQIAGSPCVHRGK